MLRKIISIKNVGRFLNYSASGDIELKHYNLIFAENGRGKTTLCAILRSLQSGEPAHVIGRTTLGTGDTPEIKVLLDEGTATFINNSWSVTVPQVVIFDSTFVSENIYSGDFVDLDQKRKLYSVIVGKQGVDMARKIEKFDVASREKSTEIREKRAAIQALVPPGLTIEDFLSLQEDPAIESKIAEKMLEYKAVKEVDQIKSRAPFSELNLPVLPDRFETLLGKTIKGITEDAEQRIGNQIKSHMMQEHGEVWLSEGFGYIRNNTCPFCNQKLDGAVALMAAYNAYFSEAYNALQTEITTFRQEVEHRYSEREIARIERLIDQNEVGAEFWSRYCKITLPVFESGKTTVMDTLREFRQIVLSLLERKVIAPHEHVVLTPDFIAIRDALDIIKVKVETYNKTIQAANIIIADKKETAVAVNMREVESALTRLHATKKRYDLNSKEVCKAYEVALAEKKILEEQKENVKRELDAYTNKVMDQYEQTINMLLDDFNAGFRITETRHGYPGGVASCNYQILINNTAIDLGDERTPLDKPSFRNTLSSGDKSTLGLTFFLAQLIHDPDRTSKIVVFDDPFNSQDSFRKNCTIQKIKKCGMECAQVIVLSHDNRFLKLIWDQLTNLPSDSKCLWFARVGIRNIRILEWNIEEAMLSQFKKDHQALVDYYNNAQGQPSDVIKKIRPILETYCCNLYQSEFIPSDSLGAIIAKIRQAGSEHPLFIILDDLEILNTYTTPYAHGQLDGIASSIDDNELHGFIKKTLTITGGC